MDQNRSLPAACSLMTVPHVQDAGTVGWNPPLPPAVPQACIAIKHQKTQAVKKQKKPRAKAATGTSRRGWGPFQSVLKERSMDFNLTLDVQSLRQEIQDMETLRALLRTKTLVRRHTADGSLLRVAREFYRVFRTGFMAPGARKRSVCEQEQWDYLYSTMDECVDVGNGLYGPEVMGQQLQIYSTFIRYLDLSLLNFDIITADESAVVATHGTFRFQVLRNTIQHIFPHVMGNEELVARLIGRQIAVLAKITFYFNADGKCAKYEVDIDYLGAFATIVSDPHDLDLLFGRALIAENCMFGVLASPEVASVTPGEDRVSLLDKEATLQVAPVSSASTHSHQGQPMLPGRDEVECVTDGVMTPPGDDVGVDGLQDCCASPSASTRVFYAQRVDYARRLVYAYFSVYSPVPPSAPAGRHKARISEDRFVADYCEPTLGFCKADIWVGLNEKWSDLRECFDVVNFRLVHEESIDYDAPLGAHRVDVVGVYELEITPRTIELIFPHITEDLALVAALVHRAVQVESLLTFWVSEATGKLQRIREQMDFPTAIGTLVPHPADLAFVLQQALITTDGVLWTRPCRATDWEQEAWREDAGHRG